MDAMMATEIMSEVRALYATCRSYRDTGEVWVNWDPDNPEPHTTFSTAFVRPNHFRFEVIRKGTYRFIVHSETHRVKARYFVPIVHPKSSRKVRGRLGRMVAPMMRFLRWILMRVIELEIQIFPRLCGMELAISSAGTWEGDTDAVARLLMPERVNIPNAATADDVERLDDDDLEGVPYYRVLLEETQVMPHGKRETRHSQTVFWVDQRTFLLRRIESCWWYTGPDRWRTCTDFWPELNVHIAEEELAFGLHP